MVRLADTPMQYDATISKHRDVVVYSSLDSVHARVLYIIIIVYV